jgi:hypothetical protein
VQHLDIEFGWSPNKRLELLKAIWWPANSFRWIFSGTAWICSNNQMWRGFVDLEYVCEDLLEKRSSPSASRVVVNVRTFQTKRAKWNNSGSVETAKRCSDRSRCAFEGNLVRLDADLGWKDRECASWYSYTLQRKVRAPDCDDLVEAADELHI